MLSVTLYCIMIVFSILLKRLMEPKKELIERVVNVIGTKKAIELLSETAMIEQNGGLYTVVSIPAFPL